MADAYEMDYEWLWGRQRGNPGNDGTPATVRLTVRGTGAVRAVRRWLDGLDTGPEGVWGGGGWAVTIVELQRDDAGGDETAILDITSAGEDVADGIFFGTAAAHDALAPLGLALGWKNLPRPRRRRRRG